MTTAGVEAAQPEVSPRPSRPRVVIRADLRPAVSVLAVVAVLGVPLGLLWSWLAPPEIVRVLVDPATGQVGVLPLAGQSEHRFGGMAIFVLLGIATGVLSGAALWLLRQRRGPVVLVAAVLGSVAAAWLAMRVGLWLVQWRYPGPAGAQPGDVVVRAPVLESAWVVVAQPFGVALAYSLAVAWNSTADLGRSPS
ncbi:MAG: DUF2567 domain-containing protein [Pseudonocardiaceae bacterium]